jgi:hypothetical protein
MIVFSSKVTLHGGELRRARKTGAIRSDRLETSTVAACELAAPHLCIHDMRGDVARAAGWLYALRLVSHARGQPAGLGDGRAQQAPRTRGASKIMMPPRGDGGLFPDLRREDALHLSDTREDILRVSPSRHSAGSAASCTCRWRRSGR